MKKLIIVLALPRTGSSLLMQTLKQLNVEIIGNFERNDLPQGANPNGYYEDIDILSKGLTKKAIEKIEKNKSEVVAIKIAIEGMIKDNRLEQWQYLQEKRATILVTIRPPLESAVSYLIFNNKKNELVHFKKITTFIRNYRLTYKTLSEILISKVTELIPRSYTVDYHLALNNPQKYVQNIIKRAELVVSESQFQNALENIDLELYRNNQNLFEENIQKWPKILGADQIYNILSTQKKPWEIILGLKDKQS